MPHKRNPEGLEQVVVLARLARTNAALTVEGMIQEHERDGRGARLEWIAVPEVSHYTLASLAILRPILAGLTVHEDHMASQVDHAAEHLCTEALMLTLGRKVGKLSAHGQVYELSQSAQSVGVGLHAALGERPDIVGHLAPGELEAAMDPSLHVGEAGAMVDQVRVQARQWLDRGRDGNQASRHLPPDRAPVAPR